MKLQRYKSSGHYSDGACDHGEWVRAEEAEAAIAELERKYAVVRKTLSDIAYAFVVTEEAILIMKKMAREALEKEKQ